MIFRECSNINITQNIFHFYGSFLLPLFEKSFVKFLYVLKLCENFPKSRGVVCFTPHDGIPNDIPTHSINRILRA